MLVKPRPLQVRPACNDRGEPVPRLGFANLDDLEAAGAGGDEAARQQVLVAGLVAADGGPAPVVRLAGGTRVRYVRTNVKGTFVAEVLVGPGPHAGRTVFVNERDLWYGPQEETIRLAEVGDGHWPFSKRQRFWAAVTAALAVLAGAVLARSLAG